MWNVNRIPQRRKCIIRIKQTVKIAGQTIGDNDIRLCRQLVLAISERNALHGTGVSRYNDSAQSGYRWSRSAVNADTCCARATLRGAFLARGLLGNPADAYHLELALPENGATLVAAAAARTGIPLKSTTRRGRTVFYLKGAEPISRLLGLMGANRAVMRFENDRILRDMRSQANRRTNGETANLDKRLRAALQQREAIRRLQARDARLHGLAPALREIAELRLAHPRAGLKELAELAQVSKSAVANRLRRLVVQANRNGLID